MVNSFEFKSNWINKQGVKFVELPSEVLQILLMKDFLIVLVKKNENTGNRNIYCFDSLKQMRWQIPKPIEIHDNNYFTGIYAEESRLCAYNVNGVEYHIELETGLILKSELIK